MKRFVVLAIAAAVVLGLSGGCIFDPRDPAEPDTAKTDPWIVPNSPIHVFANLESGFEAASNSNYERSLHDSFTFIPREEDRLLCSGCSFDNWTRDVELQVLSRIKSDYAGARTIRFGDALGKFGSTIVVVPWAYYEGEYQIVLQAGTPLAETYAGYARFTMFYSTQGWEIRKWEDLDIIGSFPTSGILRGTLRSGG